MHHEQRVTDDDAQLHQLGHRPSEDLDVLAWQDLPLAAFTNRIHEGPT
jgi:hypothetical protein